MDFLTSTGPWLYPLAALAVCLLASVLRAIVVIRSSRPVPPAGPPHHPVLAWGALGLVVGLLGTVVGVARLGQAARPLLGGGGGADLERLLDVVERGAIVVVSPLGVGLALFTLSLVFWLALGFALNRTVS
ncbi:MAG: hypothetical protein R3304_01135 [Longimicrobiales bacterium]|nr:hypothetical protein [Longimicrobiales bacterium]